MIRFFVPGTPKAMSVGKSIQFKRGQNVHRFQQRRNTEWCTLVGEVGGNNAPATPMVGGLAFTATFYLARPASLKKSERLPLKRPDIDNLVHKLTDQFNGVFWLDDSQIVDLIVRKRFTPDGRTGVEIYIEPVHLAELPQPQQPPLITAPA